MILAFIYLLYSSNQTSNWDKYVERTSVPKEFSKSDHQKIEDLIEEVQLLENKFHKLELKLGTEDSEIENDVIRDQILPAGGAQEKIDKNDTPVASPEKKSEKKVRPDYLPVSKCPEMTEAVDAVYTWVNGSDPEFVNSLKETDLGLKTHKDDTHNQRFAGKLLIKNIDHDGTRTHNLPIRSRTPYPLGHAAGRSTMKNYRI